MRLLARTHALRIFSYEKIKLGDRKDMLVKNIPFHAPKQ